MSPAIRAENGYRDNLSGWIPVKENSIARNFKRRLSGNHFLRESLVTLEKE